MKEYGYSKRAILRMLSEDARTPITALAEYARCSRNTALSNLKLIEEEFGVRYVIEFNKEILGLSQRHILKIKYGSKPNLNEIVSLLAEDSTIQFAASTKGNFDLLIYAESDSGYKYMQWETALALKLAPYNPVIRPSQIIMTHVGFMPLSDKALQDIDLSKLGLDSIDKAILLLLNKNSRTGYSEISRKLNITEDKVRYRFRRITKSGVIKSFTIVMTKLSTYYNLAMFVNYRFALGTELRARKAREHYMSIDGDMPLINKFQFLAPSSGSYRFFILGCFESKNDSFINGVIKHKEVFKGDSPSISYAKIETIIKGYLPVRNVDIRKDYNIVKWE